MQKLNERSTTGVAISYSSSLVINRHIRGHYGDESSQAVNCTDTDSEKVTNWKWTSQTTPRISSSPLSDSSKTWALHKSCSYLLIY